MQRWWPSAVRLDSLYVPRVPNEALLFFSIYCSTHYQGSGWSSTSDWLSDIFLCNVVALDPKNHYSVTSTKILTKGSDFLFMRGWPRKNSTKPPARIYEWAPSTWELNKGWSLRKPSRTRLDSRLNIYRLISRRYVPFARGREWCDNGGGFASFRAAQAFIIRKVCESVFSLYPYPIRSTTKSNQEWL